VGIEVRNAQFAMRRTRASVDSARAAVELGHQSLDAEQKKYQFGTSTTTLVLQNQSQLATAESTLVNAMVAYENPRSNSTAPTGQLLDHYGISIDDCAPADRSRACPTYLRSHHAKICHHQRPLHRSSSRSSVRRRLAGCPEGVTALGGQVRPHACPEPAEGTAAGTVRNHRARPPPGRW